jgi:hypothetical protein
MVRLAFNRLGVDSYDELLERFSDDALASPRRSTVPLLALWRWPMEPLGNLGRAIGANLTTPIELSFEYTVPVRRGAGKPSCTDLMILSAESGVAIEAKFTEPGYETVQEWLGPAPSDNRRAVLAGWLEGIADTTGAAIDIGAIQALPYQMIHRAASACAVGRARAFLAYLVFGEAGDYYQEHLARFNAILGNRDQLQVRLVECPLHPLPDFLRLEQAWLAGERGMGSRVRDALATGVLFQFGGFRSVPIAVSTPPAT